MTARLFTLAAFFLLGCYSRIQFQTLGDICQRIIESQPEAEQAVLSAVKEYRNGYRTREAALKAKRNYADNLYNIAHLIKTPMTSIFLSAQMMQEDSSGHLEQICQQTARLTHLEETLLLLARIDSGILPEPAGGRSLF